MSKIYLIIRIIYVRAKSSLILLLLRAFGMRLGKKNIAWSMPTISGYLNNITVGNNCCFDQRIRIIINKEGRLKIGNDTLISSNVNINAGKGNIFIGSNIMIASNTYIINNDHNIYDTLSPKNSGHITKDIFIEDNVWIGANCTILKGVRIGEGAIVGAGSVVTKDVKPYSVNVGVPCQFIKYRFTKDELKNKLNEKRD